MMNYLVSVYRWESPRLCSSEIELNKGDRVVLYDGSSHEVAVVEKEGPSGETEYNIARKATERDIEMHEKNEEKKGEIICSSKKEIRRLELPMKLIDIRLSLDGSSIVIMFTADERVDFRELVKNLSQIFHRSVRMQQIGSRDEARRLGGCGVCGRGLCCARFSGSLPSISIDMARVQQVAHRGSERISGICGRLMCCLSYEACQYKEMLSGMPQLHAEVKTPEGKGEVIEINAITQEVKVKCEDGRIVVCKKSCLS